MNTETEYMNGGIAINLIKIAMRDGYVPDEFDGGQGPANAALYAEAHNVAQATGLSPEQMRDRLDEAVDVLKRAITSIGVYAMADAAKWTSYPQAQIRHMHKATEEYRAFLSKLKK